MSHRDFQPVSEKNGLLHPSSCACVKCAAGRDSQILDESLREKVNEMLDATFLHMVQQNVAGGYQNLAAGGAIGQVRQGFLGNMANIMRMREMAAAYFSSAKPEGI
jgi:tRNA A37 N6-isopentenylltransferase MiaA